MLGNGRGKELKGKLGEQKEDVLMSDKQRIERCKVFEIA